MVTKKIISLHVASPQPTESINPFRRDQQRASQFDPQLEKFYLDYWIGHLWNQRTDENIPAQLRGVDRILQDKNALWLIDDKVDFEAANYGNLYLEHYDNHPIREGWFRTSTAHILTSIVPYPYQNPNRVVIRVYRMNRLRIRANKLLNQYPIRKKRDTDNPNKLKGFQCIPFEEIEDLNMFANATILIE